MDSLESARLWRALFFERCEDQSTALMARLLPELIYTSLDVPLDGKSITPLIGACIANNPRLVLHLLAMGATPDHADNGGWTPLHWCCKSNRHECARILLDAGADPDAIHPKEGWSCLHFCAQSKALECARLLLTHGADSLLGDPQSGALAWQCAADDVEFSLALGGEAQCLDPRGRSCLHWAVRHARVDSDARDACQSWIARGADPAIEDSVGEKASDIARLRGLNDCAAYLDSVLERMDISASTAPGWGRQPESQRI